jgi:diguanylate cyclase
VYKQEREQALAKTALALMGECHVIPTPDNFELFYAYASGENAAITRVIGETIATRKPFTAALLQDLRTQCLISARAAQAMDNVGNGMVETLTGVLGKLEAAGRGAVDYSRALSAASGKLDDQRTPADLRKLVDGLMSATHEMEQRTKNLESELQRSSEQVNDLKSKQDDVRKESLTDPLTCVANRKAFDMALDEALASALDKGEPVSLLMCDIDFFKRFNDNWGHQTGDQVLRLVANCLSDNIKGKDTAARYGGEEFTVILRDTVLVDAIHVANQIRAIVESKKLIKKSTGDVLGTITISIGVAQFAAGENAETLVRRADACLYGAKHAGRNLAIGQNDPRMAALEIDAA